MRKTVKEERKVMKGHPTKRPTCDSRRRDRSLSHETPTRKEKKKKGKSSGEVGKERDLVPNQKKKGRRRKAGFLA